MAITHDDKENLARVDSVPGSGAWGSDASTDKGCLTGAFQDRTRAV